MNSRALHVLVQLLAHLPALFAGLLSAAALAQPQLPVKPPPWWGVQDDVTLSAYWDFTGGLASPPSFLVASPLWYNPLITGHTSSANIVPIPALAGHTGCIGMIGTGVPQVGTFAMRVDNDPHLNWVKIFWVQFDSFEGTSGNIQGAIQQDLSRYGRAIVEETSEPIGQGWERVTISAELIPQPPDETVEWTFTENAFGTIAIDNLYVCSKCVKPGPDQTGDALGVVYGPPVDLTASFPGLDCLTAAVTPGPAPAFLRTTWIGTRGPAAGPHLLFRVQGTVTSPTPLPSMVPPAQFGVCGLTVETQVTGATTQQFVYALVDNRLAPGGFMTLHKIDTTGALVGTTTLTAFPPLTSVALRDFGLAFDPSGDNGAGSFWISDPAGTAYELNRAGTQILDQTPIQPGCSGLGYDDTLGYFYGFSNTPQPAPPGQVRVNGFEWSGYDLQPTGVEFCGDITIPNPGGPPGGIAKGFEVYRPRGSQTSQLRMVCVVDVAAPQPRTLLYEVAGPYRFGWSQLGRCGMRGGPPFVGSPSFQVTLTGVPNTLGAVLFIGFSNQTYLGAPLPIPLAGIGWPESFLSISPDLSTPLLTPTVPGSFAFPLNLPPGIGLSYVPLFFQWLGLDTQVPGFLATSQAGKTVAY
jgi:hypothetical protein